MLKKNMIKTLVCVLLLATMLLSFAGLVSCGEKEDVALSSGNVSFTEGMYRYWYTQLKEYYVSQYGVTDSSDFWNTQVPNADYTYADFIDDKIHSQIKYYLAGNVLFDSYDLSNKLKSAWSSVKDKVDQEINDGVNSFGSRSEYDKYLKKKYGIDTSTYRSVKLMEQEFFLTYDYLYNTVSGIERATDAEIDAYYTSKYARIKYYMVLKNYKYRVDENGNRVLNGAGSYIQDPLTDAEKAERATYVNEVFAKGGEEIDLYVKKDYPDMLAAAPNGYYLAKSEYYGRLFTNTIVEATFAMQVGDTVLCENEDAFFIVQRLTLPDKAYKGTDKGQFDSIGEFAVNEKFETKFAPEIDKIKVNNEVCSRYSVISLLDTKYN